MTHFITTLWIFKLLRISYSLYIEIPNFQLTSPLVMWEPQFKPTINNNSVSNNYEVDNLLVQLSEKVIPISPHLIHQIKLDYFPIPSKFSLSQHQQHIVIFSSRSWLIETIKDTITKKLLNPIHDVFISVNLGNPHLGPFNTATYSDLRYVMEVSNISPLKTVYLCRTCKTSKFYEGVWKSTGEGFLQKIKDFQGYQFLVRDVEQSIHFYPHSLVADHFANRHLRRFIFPELLALLHFADKYNATFLSCYAHPQSPERLRKDVGECRSVDEMHLNFFFSTADHISSKNKLTISSYGQRFYTDGRFEITFLTYNNLQRGQRFMNLLVKPIGLQCLIATLLLYFGITLLCHLTFQKLAKSMDQPFACLFLRPLLIQQANFPTKVDGECKSFSWNLIFMMWVLYCLLITETYKGNVYKYLFVPSHLSPPQDFQQLTSSVSNYEAITISNPLKSVILESEYSVVFDRTRKLLPESFGNNSKKIVKNGTRKGGKSEIETIIEKLVTSRTAFVGAFEYIQVLEEFFHRLTGPSSITISSDFVAGSKVWILYDKPGVQEARETFSHLLVSGVLTRAKKMLFGSFAKQLVNQVLQSSSREVDRLLRILHTSMSSDYSKFSGGGVQKLRLDHVENFFVIFVVGLSVSFIGFLVEICTKFRMNRRNKVKAAGKYIN